MKNILVKFAIWVFKRYAIPCVPMPESVIPHAPFILALCEAIDSRKSDGEWKRHQIYAQLIKRFPNIPKRDLALAIEAAVRGI